MNTVEKCESALLVAAVLALGSASAHADVMQLKLTGADEVPAVTTKATGTGTLTIAADKSVVSVLSWPHVHLARRGQ